MFRDLALGRRFLKSFRDKPETFYLVDCNGYIVHGTAPFVFYDDGSKSWSSLNPSFRYTLMPRVTGTGCPFNLGINGIEENALIKGSTDDYSTVIIIKEC